MIGLQEGQLRATTEGVESAVGWTGVAVPLKKTPAAEGLAAAGPIEGAWRSREAGNAYDDCAAAAAAEGWAEF